MQVKFNPFPIMFFHTTCKRHNCEVEIHIEESKPFNKPQVIGGQITSLKCKLGGHASVHSTDCTGDWEITITGQGPIVVEQ